MMNMPQGMPARPMPQGNPVPPGAMPEEVADDVDIKASKIVSRVCSKCKVDKPISEFSPRKDRPLGKHYSCKHCGMLQARQIRLDKPSTPEMMEKAKIKSRVWRKQNPAHRNALKAAYKASIVNATPSWLNDDHKQQIISFYDLARDCQLTSGEEYQVDHIIPIRGKNICGLHVPWNLQVLPSDLNRRKSNAYE